MTQCEKVMDYIREWGSITTLEAFTDLSITRLGSRIHDLSKQGVEFDRQTVHSVNRYGEPIHYTRYSFKESKDDN